jgi:hypothetical protein
MAGIIFGWIGIVLPLMGLIGGAIALIASGSSSGVSVPLTTP